MTVYLSPFSNTVVNGATVTAGGSGYTLAPSTSTISNATWTTAPLTQSASGKLELRGTDADIVINGTSLNNTLNLIQDRLNMLRPNEHLEAEWDQLRDLGDQYRKLEKELIEKQRAWDILKKTT